MQRVFAFAENLHAEELQITSDMYLRHAMFTKRRGVLVRYIPGMFQLERGENQYSSEAHLRFQYKKDGSSDCKVVAYSTNARYLSAARISSLTNLTPRIYDARLFSERILNPLNRRNRRFYHYLAPTLKQQPDSLRPTQRILIKPRFSNEQLVKGYIDIDTSSGAVRHFYFHFRLRLQEITLSGYCGTAGNERFVPTRLLIHSYFHLLGNVVEEKALIRAEYQISPAELVQSSSASPYDLTPQYMLRVDTSSVIVQPDYFAALRPSGADKIELTVPEKYKGHSREKSHFSNPDSLDTSQADSTANSARPTSEGWLLSGKAQDLFLSSHSFALSRDKHTRVKLPPILTPSMVQWSKTRGLSLRTSIYAEYYQSQGDALPLLSFVPSLGYSFKEKQLYFRLPLTLNFAPHLGGTFYIEGGGGSHAYNNRQAEELRAKLKDVEVYDSLLSIINHYGFQDYRDNYLRGDLSLSPLAGLRLTAGVRYHRRALISWNDLASRGGLSHYLSTFGPRIEIGWTPAQYYYRNHGRRIPLYSHFPTFLLNYERGFALEGKHTRYEKIESDLHWRIPLYAMRTLFIKAGGGFYTQRGADCFIDYDYFRFEYVPSGWDDDFAGELQLLGSRWYNESRYYFRFTSSYESPMLCLSRIPYLSRAVLTERVYLNLLSVRSLGIYTEAGYGFSTHLLDIGAFLGFAPDRSVDFGCKAVLKFFKK